MNGLPSVDDIRTDLPGVLERFRTGSTRAFSFGDRGPEAVVLTYDEFEDLGGEAKFDVGSEVLEPSELADRLAGLVRAGTGLPVVWGEDGEPEAVVLSTAQYRQLRGDDEPPPGVVDDPTKRTYSTDPLPDRKPFGLGERAEATPFTQQILGEVRRRDFHPMIGDRRDHEPGTGHAVRRALDGPTRRYSRYMNGLPTVDDIRRDLPGVLARFRGGATRAFSFGHGVPEAVLLTYDEFEDLGGEAKFDAAPSVLEPAQVAAELPRLLTAIRAGATPSVLVWGEEGEPEAVILSTAQYRQLRGDDEPPAGVVDDPTQRTYTTEPQPDSVPFSLDQWAEGDPFTQQILDEIRTEEGLPPRER